MNDAQTHILVVEDDASLATWISDYLTDHGFLVSVANRGDTAVELIESDQPDLVVLDLLLPVLSGLDVCKTVRKQFSKPILMLTACSEESDEVLGLEFGADDYLSKPVRPRLLLARIRALLRRQQVGGELVRRYGPFSIDSESKTATLDGETLLLTNNEFDVLWQLASHPGEVLSRNELLGTLRGIDYDGFDRSIDIRISRLRRKLGDDTSQPRKIKTVRGKGYLFAADGWS